MVREDVSGICDVSDSLINWIGKSLEVFVEIFHQPELMKWL